MGLCRTLANHDLGRHEGLSAALDTRHRQAQRPPCAQTGGELEFQCAAPLHVERLVDGFVTDAHGLVLRKVEPEPVCDLFRAPGLRPSSILPASGPAALPCDARPADLVAARRGDPAGEPILHIVSQPRVHR